MSSPAQPVSTNWSVPAATVSRCRADATPASSCVSACDVAHADIAHANLLRAAPDRSRGSVMHVESLRLSRKITPPLVDSPTLSRQPRMARLRAAMLPAVWNSRRYPNLAMGTLATLSRRRAS